MDIDALAAAYLTRDHDRFNWEPENELSRMLSEDPDAAWSFTEAAIEASRTVGDLGTVGVGPLEEIMRRYGASFADDLVDRVRADARWAYAASMVRRAAGAEDAQAAVKAQWPDWMQLDAAATARLAQP